MHTDLKQLLGGHLCGFENVHVDGHQAAALALCAQQIRLGLRESGGFQLLRKLIVGSNYQSYVLATLESLGGALRQHYFCMHVVRYSCV